MVKETKYVEAVGRRKTATARVRAVPAKSSSVLVNHKSLTEYFPLAVMQELVGAPVRDAGVSLSVTALVRGGGLKSQAEAVRHGIARILAGTDPSIRKTLKAKGYLKRDPRAKERKKFGLKAARRAPQWSKR